MKKHLIWTNYELEEDRKWISREGRRRTGKAFTGDNLEADRDNLDILVGGVSLTCVISAMRFVIGGGGRVCGNSLFFTCILQ